MNCAIDVTDSQKSSKGKEIWSLKTMLWKTKPFISMHHLQSSYLLSFKLV